MKAKIVVKTPMRPLESPWVKRALRTSYMLRQLDLQFRLISYTGAFVADRKSPWTIFEREIACPTFEDQACTHLIIGTPGMADKTRSDFANHSALLTTYKFISQEPEIAKKFDSVWLSDWNDVIRAQTKIWGPKYWCVRSWAQMYEALQGLVRLSDFDDLPVLAVPERDRLAKWW